MDHNVTDEEYQSNPSSGHYPQYSTHQRKKAWQELAALKGKKYSFSDDSDNKINDHQAHLNKSELCETERFPLVDDQNQIEMFEVKQKDYDDVNHQDQNLSGIILDSEKKEIRKKQIQIGKRVVEFLSPESDQNNILPKRKIGRPKKTDDEKVQLVSIKIAVQYLQYLKGVSFSAPRTNGIGGKIRFIIENFLIYQKREEEQVRVLKSALSKVDEFLNEYSQIYDRSEYRDKCEKMLMQMEKSMENVRLLMSLLKFDFKDLKNLIDQNEMKTLELSFTWNKEGRQ